jgi:hypothetical protein
MNRFGLRQDSAEVRALFKAMQVAEVEGLVGVLSQASIRNGLREAALEDMLETLGKTLF